MNPQVRELSRGVNGPHEQDHFGGTSSRGGWRERSPLTNFERMRNHAWP
jgi:hypothetical protein